MRAVLAHIVLHQSVAWVSAKWQWHRNVCLCESSAFPQLYNIVIFQHKWTIQSWTFASLCAAGGSESGRNARRAVGDLDRLKGRCSASRQWVLMSRKPCSQASANTCPNLSQCPPATHTSPAPLTGALAPGQRWVWVGKLGSGLGEIVLIWQEIKMQIVTRNSKELISHFLKKVFLKVKLSGSLAGRLSLSYGSSVVHLFIWTATECVTRLSSQYKSGV